MRAMWVGTSSSGSAALIDPGLTYQWSRKYGWRRTVDVSDRYWPTVAGVWALNQPERSKRAKTS